MTKTCAAEKPPRRNLAAPIPIPNPAKRVFPAPGRSEGAWRGRLLRWRRTACRSTPSRPEFGSSSAPSDQSSCNKDFSCHEGFLSVLRHESKAAACARARPAGKSRSGPRYAAPALPAITPRSLIVPYGGSSPASGGTGRRHHRALDGPGRLTLSEARVPTTRARPASSWAQNCGGGVIIHVPHRPGLPLRRPPSVPCALATGGADFLLGLSTPRRHAGTDALATARPGRNARAHQQQNAPNRSPGEFTRQPRPFSFRPRTLKLFDRIRRRRPILPNSRSHDPRHRPMAIRSPTNLFQLGYALPTA